MTSSATRVSRSESQAQTRLRLVATARTLFLTDGYAATSLERVAAEAGFSKGAVYSNFAGKDDRCLAVLDTIHGEVAEARAATSAREREKLSWEAWSERLTAYFRHLERLFTPDLFVVGGGVSKSWDKFGHLIQVETEMVPATLQNRAGIVGAALVAHRLAGKDD